MGKFYGSCCPEVANPAVCSVIRHDKPTREAGSCRAAQRHRAGHGPTKGRCGMASVRQIGGTGPAHDGALQTKKQPRGNDGHVWIYFAPGSKRNCPPPERSFVGPRRVSPCRGGAAEQLDSGRPNANDKRTSSLGRRNRSYRCWLLQTSNGSLAQPLIVWFFVTDRPPFSSDISRHELTAPEVTKPTPVFIFAPFETSFLPPQHIGPLAEGWSKARCQYSSARPSGRPTFYLTKKVGAFADGLL
jgi:hypothetical protein